VDIVLDTPQELQAISRNQNLLNNAGKLKSSRRGFQVDENRELLLATRLRMDEKNLRNKKMRTVDNVDR
jgi:hypothetical protein